MGLLKNLAPAAANWGMNKLLTSSFGQKHINPILMNNLSAIQSGTATYQPQALPPPTA